MIRLAEAAKADLQSIDRRLRPRAGAVIAGRVIEAILTAISRLDRMPLRGRPGRLAGTRELVITRYPYLVVYEVAGDDVNVARVMHTRQQWPRPEDEAPTT